MKSLLKNRTTLALCAGLVLIGLTSLPADAAPILGARVFYTGGGSISVETQAASSDYKSELGIYDSSLKRLLYLVDDEPAATSATFDPSAMGFATGAELIFGIRVVSDNNHEYFLGPRLRNPDRVRHGAIDVAGGVITVSFEDIFGGGDRDYNDVIFQFVTDIGTTPRVIIPAVPEPATLALLALGLGGLRLARRRRT